MWGVGGGRVICYIILGGCFPEILYNVIKGGGGQKFQIFALYNMCTTPIYCKQTKFKKTFQFIFIINNIYFFC